MHAVGNVGVGNQNSQGDALVQFAERNKLSIIITPFRKRNNVKWTWGNYRGETDFILCAKHKYCAGC